MENKEKVNKFLKKLKEQGKIETWGYDTCSYWNNVPYIVINGNQVFLKKTYYYLNSLCIKTVLDFKSEDGMKNFINKCLENRGLEVRI